MVHPYGQGRAPYRSSVNIRPVSSENVCVFIKTTPIIRFMLPCVFSLSLFTIHRGADHKLLFSQACLIIIKTILLAPFLEWFLGKPLNNCFNYIVYQSMEGLLTFKNPQLVRGATLVCIVPATQSIVFRRTGPLASGLITIISTTLTFDARLI